MARSIVLIENSLNCINLFKKPIEVSKYERQSPAHGQFPNARRQGFAP